jgi:7-carboxy-7-deazaguanine synthase
MILVNEIYGPVRQGEGKSAGKDVMFMRLSGCNLACIWCDTPYTWNWIGTKFAHPDKFDKKLEAHKMTADDVKAQLYDKTGKVRGLVISGGEPMLQQKELIPFLQSLIFWWVEVETNGTIEPTDQFLKLVNQINCSPKTSNSGIDNPLKLRYKKKALKKIADSDKSTFKFVVQSDQDLKEVQDIIADVDIAPEKVWLMPEGRTKIEQLEKQEQVKELVKKFGYNFSPRLHILEHDSKRGV